MKEGSENWPENRLENRLSMGNIVTQMATPLSAVLIAILLTVAGLAAAFQLEQLGRVEKLRQITVQARILANGIAAPLAFEDDAALQEYLNALKADPQIVAVAAYDSQGAFAAGFARRSASLPRRAGDAKQAAAPGALAVTVPVHQGGTQLGSVYLLSTMDSLSRRLTRYLGIAVIVIAASVLIVMLAASYSSLRRSHQALRAEIAGRQQAEEALRQSQKMEAMGQLTGGVAHDFNNLLMVASGGLDLMERTSDPVRLTKLKAGIRQAVDRGAKLTRQLLAFSRRSPLNPEVIDPRARIKGMDALLERSLGESIEVAMHLPADLWPVEVDASELEVAILNIALNARDAMQRGGTIVIEGANLPGTGDRPDRVRIAVTDKGAGIAPDLVNKIFEPFYTTKAIGQGTGLGLSQVYGFARASGGEVLVDSIVGQGTTITLLLPRSPLAPKGADSLAEPMAAFGTHRILLVEDDDTVADTVGGMLTALGYETERVDSGDEALRRLERQVDFSLILSDMIMPGEVSGMELALKVRQLWPHLGTMLMTGYSAAAASAAKEGVPLLAKPFTIQDLSVQLMAVLDQPGQGRA
ncbi:ATP-binding protein [Sphingobium sp. JS3065]|uniref:ATP-binding protein n=1 Tax=Sphingobium sp. JS3065 TaxID=2970925 RepID=UPI002264E295|nr:ATP-binding protein [Sphingobium sp. JS3065]UZW57141.1 ATP-binding protein [Sphingobium sp. JS3065]